MAAFYLDENVSLGVEDELRPHGHIVATTVAERRLRAPDPHQLLYAAERRWTIVTHNRRDFWLLHDAWLLWSRRWGVTPSHAGILVLEMYERQTAADIASVIVTLLSDPATSLETALYEWQRSTGWIRFPG